MSRRPACSPVRVMSEGGGSAESRLRWAYRRALSREPEPTRGGGFGRFAGKTPRTIRRRSGGRRAIAKHGRSQAARRHRPRRTGRLDIGATRAVESPRNHYSNLTQARSLLTRPPASGPPHNSFFAKANFHELVRRGRTDVVPTRFPKSCGQWFGLDGAGLAVDGVASRRGDQRDDRVRQSTNGPASFTRRTCRRAPSG